MKNYYSIREAASYLSARLPMPIHSEDVLRMAAEGELRFCFYFDGRLNYFPEYAPWEYDSTRREWHHFRGYLQIPARLVMRIDEAVSIYGVKRFVQSLHEVDGVAPPPAIFTEGRINKDGGFSKSVVHRSDGAEEIHPESFLVLADHILVPRADMETIVSSSIVTPAKSVSSDGISAREHTTYLNVIATMLEMLITHRSGRTSQGAVISEMVESWSERPGVSKSNLEKMFAEANRRVGS